MEEQINHEVSTSSEKKRDLNKSNALLDWLVPLALIVAVSSFTFFGTSVLDIQFGEQALKFWNTLLFSDADSQQAVSNLAEVLIGVLGLTLTVVAIVVQLAAQRYTPKLVDLFLEDRVNIITFLGMVFSTIFCIWIIYSTRKNYTPVFGNLVLILLTTVLLTLLIPYFRYVFRFLTPSNIIETIEANLARSVGEAIRKNGRGNMEKTRSQVANGLEQVTDIALSAVTQMDRNVALMSIDTVTRILANYIKEKPSLHEPWFRPNPSHFISISSEFLEDIVERRIWVEARGFMDLELLFLQSLKTMPDAVSAIAANTRQLAIAAIESGDEESAYFCVEYFNTFLRRAVNDRNQRAVFSLFYQYRRLVEYMLPTHMRLVEEITRFIHYYGNEAQRVGMPFLVNVAAMDICYTLQRAYDLNITPIDNILEFFLKIAESPDLQEIEFVHKGVRKAHIILAAYLMLHGKSKKDLKKIQTSLKLEKPAFLRQVRSEILNVTKRKFWEITDRGGLNFEYIEQDMKDSLNSFYEKYL